MITDSLRRGTSPTSINVHLPTDLAVPAPEVTVNVPPAEVTVNLPDPEPPQVTVNVEKPDAPVVNVYERELPAPIVNIPIPESLDVRITRMPRRVKKASRNSKGQVEGTVEVDA
jgi:hypothetical protein